MMEENSGLKFEESGLTPALPVKRFIKHFRTANIVKLHYHSSLEVNVCTGVKGRVFLNGTGTSLNIDCVIFIPPETPHSYAIEACEGSIEVLHFLLSSLPGAAEAFEEWSEPVIVPLSKCSGIPELTAGISAEGETPLLVSGRLLMIAGQVFKGQGLYVSQDEQAERHISAVERDNFLERIIEFTERKFAVKLELSDAAAVVNLSKYHFCRVFKQKTGMTWSEYLLSVRLKNSLRYLSEGLGITETAGLCGFDSDSYYIKCFKKVYFCTPLQWKKENL